MQCREEDRRPETGDWEEEMGNGGREDRRPETGKRKWEMGEEETGDRRPQTGDRKWGKKNVQEISRYEAYVSLLKRARMFDNLSKIH